MWKLQTIVIDDKVQMSYQRWLGRKILQTWLQGGMLQANEIISDQNKVKCGKVVHYLPIQELKTT